MDFRRTFEWQSVSPSFERGCSIANTLGPKIDCCREIQKICKIENRQLSSLQELEPEDFLCYRENGNIWRITLCNIRTLRHRWKGFQRLRARPRHFYWKFRLADILKNRGRRSLLRRLRLVKRGRAAEPVLSCSTHAILTDLKYSNLSLFDTTTRILF